MAVVAVMCILLVAPVSSHRAIEVDESSVSPYVPYRTAAWLEIGKDDLLGVESLRTDQSKWEVAPLPEWSVLGPALAEKNLKVVYGNPETTYKALLEPFICCKREVKASKVHYTVRSRQEGLETGNTPELGCPSGSRICYHYQDIHDRATPKDVDDVKRRLGYSAVLYTQSNPPLQGTSYGEKFARELPEDYGLKMLGPLTFLNSFVKPVGMDPIEYLVARAAFQESPLDEDFAARPHDAFLEEAPTEGIETFLENEKGPLPQSFQSYHYGSDPLEVDNAGTSDSILPGLPLGSWHTLKYGRGNNFYNYGTNNCINAIVTRYDQYGNVQMMTMMRPKTGTDPGEFQMSAGVIFITPWWSIADPEGFLKAEQLDGNFINMVVKGELELGDDDPKIKELSSVMNHYALEGGEGPVGKDEHLFLGEGEEPANKFTKAQHTPPTLTRDNLDEEGKLIGKAAIWARRAIFEKVFHGIGWKRGTVVADAEGKPTVTDVKTDAQEAVNVWKEIKTWDFHKIRAGVVDDTRATDEAWVETAYVVHHITGDEENLELFTHGSAPPNRQNVLLASWRDIDTESKPRKTMQYVNQPKAAGEPFVIENVHVLQPYDPVKEIELWHGDHSFAAAQVEQFVKANYRFTRKNIPGNAYNFGHSVAIK